MTLADVTRWAQQDLFTRSGYYDLLSDVLDFGFEVKDRTGVGTKSLFGRNVSFYLQGNNKLPLLTTRKLNPSVVLSELCWMIAGETNIKGLHDRGNSHIWDPWANSAGELGPVYGYQWRKGFGVDQLEASLDLLRKNPSSRRNLVTAWNPADLDLMAVPPCPIGFQLLVQPSTRALHMIVTQRSADLLIGVPHDLAAYAALGWLYVHLAGLNPHYLQLKFNFGDAHVYLNQVDQARELLQRSKGEFPEDSAQLTIHNEPKDFNDVSFEQLGVFGYRSLSAIKIPVAV